MIEVDLFEHWARSVSHQAVVLSVKQPSVQNLRGEELERLYFAIGQLSEDLKLVQARFAKTRSHISRLTSKEAANA